MSCGNIYGLKGRASLKRRPTFIQLCYRIHNRAHGGEYAHQGERDAPNNAKHIFIEG